MSETIDAVRARHQARQLAHAESPADADLGLLLEEATTLEQARDRTIEEQRDLRASSELWCRLYEANVLRANRAERETARLELELTSRTDQLALAHDRLTLLTRALETILQMCKECGGRGTDPTAFASGARLCESCLTAVRALQEAGLRSVR
jgi:hypothetical protein